jgi:UDPglucose 6-dehydrogenase
MKKNKIFMIGMWHLGCVNAACMKYFGNNVACFDFNPNVIDDISAGKLPVHEEGLREFFTDDIILTKDISDASDYDYIFITYDIEEKGTDGTRIGIESLLNKLTKELKPFVKGKTIIIRSQVILGFCDRLKKALECEVCYFPENLRLGTAITNFLAPGWMVFGLSSPALKERIDELFSPIQATRVFTGLREAEMIKLTMNCYLATMISFSGEISNLCERYAVDARTVMSTLKLDKRVSPHAPIRPGTGFSGGTIGRDLAAIIALGSTPVLDAVESVNLHRRNYIKNRLKQLLGVKWDPNLKGKTITFFGATYKAGTDTLRDSPTLKEMEMLKHSGVTIKVFDPLVKTGIAGIIDDINDAKNSDAIVIMTDWEGWKNIDYASLNPTVILDTKGILPEHIKHYEIGVGHQIGDETNG